MLVKPGESDSVLLAIWSLRGVKSVFLATRTSTTHPKILKPSLFHASPAELAGRI